MNLVKSIVEPTAAGKDVEALQRLDGGQGRGWRPAQHDEDDHYCDPDYDDGDCDSNQYNDVSYDLRCSSHIVDDQLFWGEIYSIR